MTIVEWTLLFLLNSLWWKWILSWGGAQWIEGWKSFFLIDWFALDWTAEQIRFYALCVWVLTGCWFVLGLFVPGARFASLLMLWQPVCCYQVLLCRGSVSG